jgi:hypothetical protein
MWLSTIFGMKKVLTTGMTLLLLISLQLPSAHAVWNGNSAPEIKRAIPIFFDPLGPYCASAFLYAPRIVFTAAHSIFKGNDLKEEPIDQRVAMWFGNPGKVPEKNGTRVFSEKVFISPNYKSRDFFRGGKNITRQNDFAVIVLQKPIEINDKPVELLTPEMHDKFIASGEKISMMGYGAQDKSQMSDSVNCTGREPKIYDSEITQKSIDAPPFTWTSTLNFKVAPNMPNQCDGDSGSGYIKILPDRYIYLGAAGAGGINNSNCRSWDDALNRETINAADPVYQFLDLIKEAERYVADNPYKAPAKKITITCTKNKASKKFSGANPTCPTGYKKIK